jgi:hypothetical protein
MSIITFFNANKYSNCKKIMVKSVTVNKVLKANLHRQDETQGNYLTPKHKEKNRDIK